MEKTPGEVKRSVGRSLGRSFSRTTTSDPTNIHSTCYIYIHTYIHIYIYIVRQYYITCTHPGRYAYYMRAYHNDITLHVHIIKRPSIGNLSATIGNRSTTYSIEHPLTIYRIPIERPSVIYWLSTNRSISSIYRKLSEIYRTSIKHRPNIYR